MSDVENIPQLLTVISSLDAEVKRFDDLPSDTWPEHISVHMHLLRDFQKKAWPHDDEKHILENSRNYLRLMYLCNFLDYRSVYETMRSSLSCALDKFFVFDTRTVFLADEDGYSAPDVVKTDELKSQLLQLIDRDSRLDLIRHCHLETALNLNPEFCSLSETQKQLNIDSAAGIGALKCVQFLHELGGTCTEAAMDEAAEGGYLRVMKYLHSIGKEGSWRAIRNAAESGFQKCVEFLITIGHYNSDAIPSAFGNKHMEVFRCLLKESENHDDDILQEALDNDDEPLVRHLVDVELWDVSDLIQEAQEEGDADLVELLGGEFDEEEYENKFLTMFQGSSSPRPKKRTAEEVEDAMKFLGTIEHKKKRTE